MLSSTVLGKLQLRVISAFPVQYEAYHLAVTSRNDLFQGDAKQTFLVLRRTARIIPESGDVPREIQQFPLLDVSDRVLAALFECHELGSKLRLRCQRFVPAAFKFRSYKPIRGVYSIVLTPRKCHFIARAFQHQRFLLNALVTGSLEHGDCFHRSSNSERRQTLH